MIAIALTKDAPTTLATAVDDYRVPYPVNAAAALASTGVVLLVRACACASAAAPIPQATAVLAIAVVSPIPRMPRAVSRCLPSWLPLSLRARASRGLPAEKHPNIGPRQISTRHKHQRYRRPKNPRDL